MPWLAVHHRLLYHLDPTCHAPSTLLSHRVCTVADRKCHNISVVSVLRSSHVPLGVMLAELLLAGVASRALPMTTEPWAVPAGFHSSDSDAVPPSAEETAASAMSRRGGVRRYSPARGPRLWVTVLRYDNGGEYVSNALKALHDEHGARHQTAVPDTPQQNNPALRLDLCSAPDSVVSYSPCRIQIDAMVEPPTKARSVLVAEKKVAEDAEDVEEVSGDDNVENELSLRSASDGESVDADDDGKDDKQNDQSEQSADVNQGCGGFEDKLRRSSRAWRPRVESWSTVTLVAHNAPMT